MIKIERKETEKTEQAIADLQKANDNESTYNIESVNRALREVFHGKCYICENKAATCAHCNNIKSDKYESIIDCTKEPVEKMIAFRKKGYFGTDEKLEFIPIDKEREDVKNTIALLEAVYYGTTPQKKIEAQIIRKTLRQNLSNFKEYVREYQETEDKEEKEDIGYLLKKELRDSAAFAAFKRWLIWDNEMFSEIEQFILEN